MKLELVKLEHTDIWPLEETPWIHFFFFELNFVIHVGFQKLRYLWIPSKKWHHSIGPINRSLGLHLYILGQKPKRQCVTLDWKIPNIFVKKKTCHGIFY